MRFEIDRSTIITVIFIIIVAVILGVNQFLDLQPPTEITVVVDPLAESWITDTVAQYNANNTSRVRVNLQFIDDLDIWRGNAGWSGDNQPDAWIPASSLSLDYVPPNLNFEVIEESIIYTPLVWGGFQNRVDELTNNGTLSFDWTAVQRISSENAWSDGSFVNMAINWPTSSMAGVAAIADAASSYQQVIPLDQDALNDAEFENWFQPLQDSMLNSQRLSGNPAQTMAARGTTAADFALLTESQWLEQIDSLTTEHNISFSYSSYAFPLDFPIVFLPSEETGNNQAAVQSFADYLTSDGQGIAIEHGFRSINIALDQSAALFIQGEPYGILLELPLRQDIADLDRNTTLALISLLN